MTTILTISWREITRLKGRFAGKSRIALLAIILLAAVVGYAVYEQDIGMSRHLYTVGASPDAPQVTDERFDVIPLVPRAGYNRLWEGSLDLYLDGSNVLYIKDDDRSLYALGAIKEYLERQELLRVSREYEVDQAFPLRVEIRHMKVADEISEGESVVSLAEVLGWEDGSSPDSPDGGGISATTDAVRDQLEEFRQGNGLPEFQAEFAPEKDIFVPSLSRPPLPMAQILLSFLYVIPIFMVGVFFISSFMEEKINRKLIVLLSAPLTPFQLITGKMLPYIAYSVTAILVITAVMGGDLLLSLAIFTPVSLLIFSALLMVALLYRTFKDQTFFSIMAAWVVIAYLVAPAMFTGVSDVSYFSPMTLAVLMYRDESFSLGQYFLSTLPLYLLFAVIMFIGVRIFNEEYLMGFRPLHRKLADAVYLVMDKGHPGLSCFAVSLMLIPVVLMVEFAAIVIGLNLSESAALGVIFILAILSEEIAKSGSVAVMIQSGTVTSMRGIVKLSLFSAVGFAIGEKALLYLTLSVVSQSDLIDAAFDSGLILLPMTMHFVTTSIVCLLSARFGLKYYPLAILAGALVHTAYNLIVMSGEVI